MSKLEIALDLGTSYTSIYVSGNGIVLCEPSVIAYYDEGVRRRTRAVGNDAYYMMGKTPDKTKIVRPIADGRIKDAGACADMLSAFIQRIMPESYLIKPKISCILGVPIGITVDEREMYEDVLFRAGINEVSMVNSIMLAAIGAEMPVSGNSGGFITSIGGGSTELATISICGIVSGCSISIGGDLIDSAVRDAINGIYRIDIGLSTARKVKETICSLVRNDCATMTVSGIDNESRAIRTQVISADNLYGTIYLDADNNEVYHDIVYGYYKNIISAMGSVINKCTAAMAADIERSGIVITGGGAAIPGLREVAEKQLKLKVRIPKDCKYTTVRGGGKLLSDPELLEEILLHA